MITPVLRIEYLTQIKKYQVMKYEQGSPRVLSDAPSAIELIERITILLRRDYSIKYEISYSPAAWYSLTRQEKGVLEGIIELHTLIVHTEKKP